MGKVNPNKHSSLHPTPSQAVWEEDSVELSVEISLQKRKIIEYFSFQNHRF